MHCGVRTFFGTLSLYLCLNTVHVPVTEVTEVTAFSIRAIFSSLLFFAESTQQHWWGCPRVRISVCLDPYEFFWFFCITAPAVLICGKWFLRTIFLSEFLVSFETLAVAHALISFFSRLFTAALLNPHLRVQAPHWTTVLSVRPLRLFAQLSLPFPPSLSLLFSSQASVWAAREIPGVPAARSASQTSTGSAAPARASPACPAPAPASPLQATAHSVSPCPTSWL